MSHVPRAPAGLLHRRRLAHPQQRLPPCSCFPPWLFHPSPGLFSSLPCPRAPTIALSPALTITLVRAPHSVLLGCCHLLLPSPVLEQSQRKPLPVMGYWACWAASLHHCVSAHLFLYEHWALVYEMGALVPTQIRYWRTIQDMVTCKPQKRNQEVFWHCLL